MRVHRPTDPGGFLRLAGPLLERAEARNALPLGIASSLISRPELYPTFHLWVGVDAGEPVAAAVLTPPHELVLADPASEEALEALLGAIAGDGVPVPGVVGNEPFVQRAAERWGRDHGLVPRVWVDQGLYELTAVREVARPPGRARRAEPRDRALLIGWTRAFAEEALPEPMDEDEIERSVDARLGADDATMWLWERDGEPVSLAGSTGRTPHGMRVGPVYTPPEHRRRGYATALVAELSRWLLSTGLRSCFLYTDLANPTSNRIYLQIGYEWVCRSVRYRFG